MANGEENDRHWILDDDRRPVLVDMMQWAKWLQNRDRHVGKDTIAGYEISTVFLGIDHNFGGQGPPVLWETMVFGDGNLDMDMDRCSGTWEQAEEMHRRMCKTVREALGIEKPNKEKAE